MMLFAHISQRICQCAVAALLVLAPSQLAAQEQDDEFAASPPAVAELPAGAVAGLGDINLFPKRLVLDGKRQIATIGLYNKAASEGEYEITLHDLRMTPEGQLLPISPDDPAGADVKVASSMLRHSPRRVTLRPDESQTVRVMVRAPAELPMGEYRTHFQVVSIPGDIVSGTSITDAVGGRQEGGIGVTIRPRIGLSIPVIVRIGETTLTAGITDAKVTNGSDGGTAVEFLLTRSGTRSAYGDITISADGVAEPLAVLRGIGIYPEIAERRVVVPVAANQLPLRQGSRLTITFTDDDFAPGTVLATHQLTVP